MGTLRKLECTPWSDHSLSSPLLGRTWPRLSLIATFKLGICQRPWRSIYISDSHLPRPLWLHLYFRHVLHCGAMCITNLFPISFVCSVSHSLIFPSSKCLGWISPCSPSPGYWWVCWFPPWTFSVWRTPAFTACLPSIAFNCSIFILPPVSEYSSRGSVTRTHHRATGGGGCMVFREKCKGVGSVIFSLPQPLADAWCVFSWPLEQSSSSNSWTGRENASKDMGLSLAFDRDVSHKVWICLFLNIFTRAILNSFAPFLPIYTESVDNKNN